MTSEYFITVGKDGKILLMAEATPPHELKPDQVGLTEEEYKFLKACRGDLFKARSILHMIEKKIKENING